MGFFAKQQVLYCSNSAGFYFLSVIAILMSVISASYYLKIIKVLHTYPSLNIKKELKEKLNDNKNINQGLLLVTPQNEWLSNIHSLIIGILTLSIMLFIFNPELIMQSVAIIANFLFNV